MVATSRRRLPGSEGAFVPQMRPAVCSGTCGRPWQRKRGGMSEANGGVERSETVSGGEQPDARGQNRSPFSCSYEYLFFFMGFSVWYLDFYLYFVILQNS